MRWEVEEEAIRIGIRDFYSLELESPLLPPSFSKKRVIPSPALRDEESPGR
jgi:hypothetical protein